MDITATSWRTDKLPKTIADRTRRVYDRMAFVYPASTFFFHSRAHAHALDASGIEEGMRVLEIATGSGEMFRRLIRANRSGATVGLDLSPNMAARTQKHARRRFPNSDAHCQAVDARHMPFRDATFDAVVCCYLLELLSTEDIAQTLREVNRVLRPDCKFTLVCIGQDTELFNGIYRLCGKLAPAFWGRQVERRVPELIEKAGMRITRDELVRQSFYPSRVLVARK
jgi:ubiquinone/menaquinone biosynthesis C-methylase UbiE